MEVWLRVARVLDCLGQKYNDPYHLLSGSEKVEICDQGWPGYSTASVRSIMTLSFAVRIREGGNRWSRVERQRVLDCLSRKYNDPYHLLSGSEKVEICDQRWRGKGYSTASVRSIMTPTICCQDQRRWKSVIKGGQGTRLPQSEV